MFNLVSALTTPTALLKPLSPAQTPATAGAPQGGQTGSRVRDNFAMAVGTGHAADIGALATATGNAREGASLLPDYREIHGRNGSLPLPGHHRPTDIENRPLSPVIEERVDAMTEICGREGIEALASGLPSDDEDLKDGVALQGPQLPGEAVSQDEIDKLFGLSG